MYELLIAIILILTAWVNSHENSEQAYRRNIRSAIAICVILIVMAAFRAPSVGADTRSYIYDYKSMPFMTFDDINYRYKGYLGYYYISKIFSLAGAPLWLWFGFVEAVYVAAIFLFYKRFSANPLFSILLFVTTGLFAFSMAGMKQVLAMAAMLYSFHLYIDKKYLWSLILCVFVYTCHPAALVMLVAFILYSLRESKFFNSIIIASILVTLFGGEWLLTSMVTTAGIEHFEAYLDFQNTYTSTTLIYYLLLLGISLYGYKGFKDEYPYISKLMLGCSIIACCFHGLSLISPNAFRIAFLFAPFLNVLLPNSISMIRADKERLYLTLFTIICVVVFFLYTNRETGYKFI